MDVPYCNLPLEVFLTFYYLTRFSQIGLPNESAHCANPGGLFPTLWFVTKTVVPFPKELFKIILQFPQSSDLFLDQFVQLRDMPEVCVFYSQEKVLHAEPIGILVETSHFRVAQAFQ
jgi:hypothetical protein